jgi:hypothetical protein
MSRPLRPVCAHRRLIGSAALLLLGLAGCDPTSLDATAAGSTSPFTLLSAPLAANGTSFDEIEPNEDFASADTLAIDQTGGGTINAALGNSQDIDVFDVGAASIGDRIVITVRTSPGLSLSIGAFDASDLLQFVSRAGGTVPMYFETACQEATSHVYIVVAGPAGLSAYGSYSLDIQRSAGAVPAFTPQVIVLDFDGDPAVSIGGGAAVNVPPFDAARISAKFAGQTALIKQKTLEGVRAQYAGLGVTVRSTDEPDAAAGVHSTIYFGTYNAELLGLADSVDSYNQDPSQSAIIFTDTFSLFNPLDPTVDEISQVLANVASHESGHLLGLWHVSDPKDLMDITATARQMLRPQVFGHAPLHPTVGPLGWQNEPDLLARTVGGRLNVKIDTSNQRIAAGMEADDRRGDFDFEVDRRWLSVSFKR